MIWIDQKTLLENGIANMFAGEVNTIKTGSCVSSLESVGGGVCVRRLKMCINQIMTAGEGFEENLSLCFPLVSRIAVILRVSNKIEITKYCQDGISQLLNLWVDFVKERLKNFFGLSITVWGVPIEAANDKRFVLEFANSNDVVAGFRFVNEIGDEIGSFGDY